MRATCSLSRNAPLLAGLLMFIAAAAIRPAATADQPDDRTASAGTAATATPASPWARWKYGPPTDPGFFPLAVWLQTPSNAAKYQAAGINVFVGLWDGPTEEQLAALKKVGMKVICAQNAVGLKHRDDPTIIGWMHGDEPDNAQEKKGGGYGPPILPTTIQAEYDAIKKQDPDRPVMENLGQSVAWDRYIGRGVRSNHPEDYREYLKGADFASFDIYPVAGETKPEVKDKLWLVPYGVQRLIDWSDGKKPIWCCIECTTIGNVNRAPTPRETRAEIWMAIIQGARGIVYFCHQFKPTFVEAELLHEPEMLKQIAATNAEIQHLAPVINRPALPAEACKITLDDPTQVVAATARKMKGAIYIFAAIERPGKTKATYQIAGAPQHGQVEVIGENRTIKLTDGRFEDSFAGWDVHLYCIAPPKPD
ncbi:MAG: beta-galactosidase [Planctomycetota bacterium]